MNISWTSQPRFQNESPVQDSLKGVVEMNPSLKVTQDQVVFYQKAVETKHSKVTIITGGGSGHEPAHIGFLGSGMLSAVVCGSVFASPSANQVSTALNIVTGDAGSLIVVKSYTGDRLNFGRAVERWKASGKENVKVVVVGDDCALPRSKASAGRRGLCGTILVYKIAGEAAERGECLERVYEIASYVATHVGTVGVSLSASHMEIGLGIHGEPGFQSVPISSSKSIVKTLIDLILSKDPERSYIKSDPDMVLMLNNLGSTTDIEMCIVLKDAMEYLREIGSPPTRVLQGRMMTALTMHGISLTIATSLHKDLLELLDAPTTAPSWPRVYETEPAKSQVFIQSDSDIVSTPSKPSINHTSPIASCIRAIATNLINSSMELNRLDGILGDGDCGDTYKSGAEALLKGLSDGTIPTNGHPAETLVGISDVLGLTMGGTSGAIWCILIDACAGYLKPFAATTINQDIWSSSFKSGLDAVCFYGGAGLGSRTMLDSMIPFSETLAKGVSVKEAVDAAKRGAEETIGMKCAKAGRASYVDEKRLTVMDPGAMAFCVIAEAVYESLEK